MSEEGVCLVIGIVCAAVLKDPAGRSVGGVAWILAKVLL